MSNLCEQVYMSKYLCASICEQEYMSKFMIASIIYKQVCVSEFK